MTLTQHEATRLANIRKDLLKHEAVGVDTSNWEAVFFLKLLEQRIEEIRRLKKEIHK